jgi:hypothetical protein
MPQSKRDSEYRARADGDVYARSRVLGAAARLGVADALADEVRSADDLAKTCQADVDARIACCVRWPASFAKNFRKQRSSS